MTNVFAKIAGSLAVMAVIAAPLAAQADTAGNGINARWRMQQHRITQGVRSGQLTPREYARLEGRERLVRTREAFDRRHNGGRLTGYQYRGLERQENRDSRAIYRLKHNGNHV